MKAQHLEVSLPSRAFRNLPTALVLVVVLASTPAYAIRGLDDLTGPWQLFVDDYIVESKSAVVRTYHPFTKYGGNPVLTGTEPWEGAIVYIYGTVMPSETGGGYRMWYHTLRPDDPDGDASSVLYAESADGIQWTKPNLGIHSWQGSTDNNMLFQRAGRDDIASVMHSPWDPDPAKQYRIMNYGVGGFWGSWSADGVNTLDCPGNPVLTGGGDVGQFAYDPRTEQYLGYVKLNSYVNDLKRRSVGYTATSDIQTWPALRLILEVDSYDDRWVPSETVQRTHLYGLSAFPYESMFVGLLWIFRATDGDGYFSGPVFSEIVSSHDGLHWTREEAPRPAMLPLGPAGAWDDGQLYTARAPVRNGDTLMMYYGACDAPHGTSMSNMTCSIGLTTLRKDGFASMDASAGTGSITTKEFIGTSGPLRVNYGTNAGWLKAEVLDEDGVVIAGYGRDQCVPLRGDSIDQTVTWASHSELPSGLPGIKLKFILENASIYSFMVGETAQLFDPPTVLRQPADQTVWPGSTVKFSVDATGAGALSYQWQKFGIDLADGGHCAGVTSPELTISNVDSNDAAAYRCIVRNSFGATASNEGLLRTNAAAFSGLGFASGGTSSTVTDITADGSVICGGSDNKAFIWTQANGLKSLGLPTGATTSCAYGVGTFNGTVVTAVDTNRSTQRAHRWDGNISGTGTFTALPRPRSTREWTVRAVGTDGTSGLWIAGSSLNGGDGYGREAVCYLHGGNYTFVAPLPTSPFGAHDHSDFHSVADNGFCAGQVQYPGTAPTGGARQAWYYNTNTITGTMLNTLVGAPSSSVEAVAKVISRQGQAYGGWSFPAGGGSLMVPAIWRNPTTPTALPLIAGNDNDNSGEVLALNGDGTLAGGYTYLEAGSTGDGPWEAFVWDAVNGTRQLQSSLVSQFGLILSGWSLRDVAAMSADGTVLTGNGLHNGYNEGWVVRLAPYVPPPPVISEAPVDQTACLDSMAIFTVSASGQGALGYQWQKDGIALSNNGHYAGVCTRTLTISPVSDADMGAYRCVVRNIGGSVISGQAALSRQPTTPADLDGDCDVDRTDMDAFEACVSAPGVPVDTACGSRDYDADGDVDHADWAAFQRCYSGENVLADLHCADL